MFPLVVALGCAPDGGDGSLPVPGGSGGVGDVPDPGGSSGDGRCSLSWW